MENFWAIVATGLVGVISSHASFWLKERHFKNDIIRKVLKIEMLLIEQAAPSDILDAELAEISEEYYRRGGNGYMKELLEERKKRLKNG